MLTTDQESRIFFFYIFLVHGFNHALDIFCSTCVLTFSQLFAVSPSKIVAMLPVTREWSEKIIKKKKRKEKCIKARKSDKKLTMACRVINGKNYPLSNST